ncbi:hypothetical protein A3H80_04755 [Candidatus Roizmanbacteria bacterium RIFCSPLOWO2_02_FULL_37_19]|uniref:Uncharacterized protein n=1 Tax=Candidatus Roizmanbacteria bacterium RIFCSPHIGHO2_02_FULL_37_24 TaxID=1802037 RepID=A0A1F7GWM4_9BACT|nr:MAG: hypothetical protein A3C24_00980 [Candidatus Roizmanbacteria bacterium RIFCSPHIGHO2_02_FULL_37_24]OGK54790.1 MAG: hypothetical protein A3H80_04755 [Candidatus Roizmanbacteria bacterium RIFCSPLOWO2_02_FULL_37_19]OGK59498.1 MAG: hypothetical protein A3G65_00090 [Candidatus Roizmanbacteria bacterium RIFCSPLOWO2_12_FULL_37_7b]
MKYLIFLLIYFFAATKNTHAYLDPGTGSYFLQIIAGSLLAGGYFFKDSIRTTLKRIIKIFDKVKKK